MKKKDVDEDRSQNGRTCTYLINVCGLLGSRQSVAV